MEQQNIYQKLLDVQVELKAPKGQYNSYGGFHYRSCEDILEAVKPLLKAAGLTLTLTDEPVQVGERYYIKAEAQLTCGTENIIVTAYAREAASKKGSDEAQITGMASSYARKYALCGLFLIDGEDDPDASVPNGEPDYTRAEQQALVPDDDTAQRIASGIKSLCNISPWTPDRLAPILEPLSPDEQLRWLMEAYREAKKQMAAA